MDSTTKIGAASSDSPIGTTENEVSSGSAVSYHDVEKVSLSGSPIGSAPKDANVIDFDGPNDPENPMNWTTAQKTTAIAIVSSMTFLS
jgi:hypothetical protein